MSLASMCRAGRRRAEQAQCQAGAVGGRAGTVPSGHRRECLAGTAPSRRSVEQATLCRVLGGPL